LIPLTPFTIKALRTLRGAFFLQEKSILGQRETDLCIFVKTQRTMKPIYCLLSVCLLLVGCRESRFSVPGYPSHQVSIERFDQDFQTEDPTVDSAFLYLYATSIMEVGEPGSKLYKDFYTIFHNDPDVANLYDSCETTFLDVSQLEEDLSWAFHRLTYFFPHMTIPTVYMHISGYGESIVSAPGMLSASLDKYLGANHPMYSILYEPYQYRRMVPEKLLSDYLMGWIRSEWTLERMIQKDRLLDHMIYEGKIAFLTSIVLPDEPLERVLAFTPEELAWCKANERMLWKSLLDNQMLYTTDKLNIAKFIEEGPSTAFFPDESPARAVTWLGYRIVEAYMLQNDAATPSELMDMVDAQALLSSSLYHP
jgi:hypothetical protein